MARRISWLLVALLLMTMSCRGADGGDTTASPSTARSVPITAVASSSAPAAPPAPTFVWPLDGWPQATPEAQGMDSQELAAFVERFTAEGEMDSVMIIRNGHVVLDAAFYPYPADTGHNLYSITKSVTGTLIGIVIDRGLLAGVDVPVVEILAEAAPPTIDERRASITVEDLLTMSAGMDPRDNWTYQWEGMAAFLASDDWAAHALSQPIVAEPGSRFEYSNQASFLLSAIVTEVTGMAAADFAQESLFGPLGITDYEWPASPDGITFGWSDLVLRPADAAKLGYLYLREGLWDGDRIVSREWIEAATSPWIDVGTEPLAYGYQWWVYEPLGYVIARGFGGQFIVVDPTHDLVVAFTAHADSVTPWGITSELLQRTVRSDEPLPPNPAGERLLADAVERARQGPDPGDVELSAMAAAVSGVTYAFRSNDLDLGTFRLTFGEDTAVLELDVADETVTFEVGLDRRFRVREGDVPAASRGAWSGDDRFVITIQELGFASGGTLELDFADDRVDVQLITNSATVRLVADRVG